MSASNSAQYVKIDVDAGTKMQSSSKEDDQFQKPLLCDEPKTEEMSGKGRSGDDGLGDKEWHSIPQDELLSVHLRTRLGGLTTVEHEKLLQEWGPNRLTSLPTMHWFIKFLCNLVGGFQLMLWLGAGMCITVWGVTLNDGDPDNQTLVLGIVMISIVVVTTVFQSYQEGKSDEVMEKLKLMESKSVACMREGTLQQLPADQLVPGDIVHVRGGEKVPADLRVLSSNGLKVNNASLTGENCDIKLSSEPHAERLYEAKNIARSGCNFAAGTGVGVVFATGDNTFFGAIARATTVIERPESLLKHEIERLIQFMATLAITLGISFFLLAKFYSGYGWIESIVFMIGIAVANVPEGLLPQMTVALMLTARRMLARGVLVRNLDIIETLGAVTVICSDKTGTLTCNRMTVSHVVYGGKTAAAPTAPRMKGDDARFLSAVEVSNPDFQALQRIAALNSDATFTSFESDVLARTTKGDATESGIVKWATPFCPKGLTLEQYRKTSMRRTAIAFTSSNKWMLSVQQTPTGPVTMVKGAPERVLAMCTHALRSGKAVPMTDAIRQEIVAANTLLAKRGERVLAFAQMELSCVKYPADFAFEAEGSSGEGPNFPCPNPGPNVRPVEGMAYVGLLSLVDPPRMSVKAAIHDCYAAGIQVFMITGDHPLTAHAIAKSLDLVTGPTMAEVQSGEAEMPACGTCDALVVKGSDISGFSDEDWEHVLAHRQIVFARTMPQQKQEIVVRLNARQHIVAMTGDGVNDAPALKAANVGMAMGSGTEVAKEAAQIVLLNDDFGAIVDAIREGRLIFDNLKKCIAYVLSSNVPEILPFLLFIALKLPLSIETVMILLVDIGTDLMPAVALAYEGAEQSIMTVPPRKPTDHLVTFRMMAVAYFTIGLIETGAAYFSFWQVFSEFGLTDLPSNLIFGEGRDFRTDKSWNDLDDDRQHFFRKQCEANTWYQDRLVNNSMTIHDAEGDHTFTGCEDGYRDFRVLILGYAQTAFLMTVVWGQIGNVLIRKTQVASILTWERMTKNTLMLWAIVAEIGIIFLLTFSPLNSFFQLHSLQPRWVVCGIWVLPLVVAWDETRKYICRCYPGGSVERITRF